MAYDPTRIYRTPRERYLAKQVDKAQAAAALTEDERLLQAWAHVPDDELKRSALRPVNLDYRSKQQRLKVARLRGLIPPETEAERRRREQQERVMRGEEE